MKEPTVSISSPRFIIASGFSNQAPLAICFPWFAGGVSDSPLRNVKRRGLLAPVVAWKLCEEA
jgi:hypothetical protein